MKYLLEQFKVTIVSGGNRKLEILHCQALLRFSQTNTEFTPHAIGSVSKFKISFQAFQLISFIKDSSFVETKNS